MDWAKPEVIVAVYAAFVGTVALYLEVRRWFKTGPRLKITLMVDAMTIGGDPQFDEEDLIFVTVINRGNAPTMITNMLLWEMTWWQKLRRRPNRTMIIPNPQLKGYPPNIPSELAPAKQWTGALRHRPDLIPDYYTGNFYVGIRANHRDKPYLKRIPKKKDRLPVGTKNLD